jgi:tetratricopeptide (TPR) repeat protein
MEAYVSGSAGIAAIVDGRRVKIYRDIKDGPIDSSIDEMENIFKSCDDRITLEDTNIKAALQKLDAEKGKTSALFLILAILDSSIEEEDKSDLMLCLDDIFNENVSIYYYIVNVLFSRELPENSIKKTPKSLIKSKTTSLLNLLFDRQTHIRENSNKFFNLCGDSEMTPYQCKYIEGLLINEGFFYSAAENQLNGKLFSSINFSINQALRNLKVTNAVPLGQSFKNTFKHLVANTESLPKQVDYRNEKNEIDKEFRGPTRKKPEVSAFDAYISVSSQIENIHRLLKSNDIVAAKRMATELEDSQSKDGVYTFAAQTLCQISGFAKNLKLFDLELEWALKACNIAPEDMRTYGHVADAFLSVENIDKAAEYFEHCLRDVGDNRIFGLTGLARIERIRSNPEVGLAHIEQALNECQTDAAPYNIKAELLRDCHRYEEAYFVYDFACNAFPESLMAQNGRASVLVDQKKFIEAEQAYKSILKNYNKPEDIAVAASALGFLLARLGRFAEAYKYLDKSIANSKFEDIIPEMSKARALKMQGEFKKSESLLRKLIQTRPQFPDPTDELMSLMMETGRLDDARSLYASSSKNTQKELNVQLKYSQLLKLEFNFELALQVIDKVRSEHPRFISGMIERASILKMSGNFESAKRQYQEAQKINKNDLRVRFGIRFIEQILNSGKTFSDINLNKPQTLEDYQSIGSNGLLELSKGNTKNAKALLTVACNCPFLSIKQTFSPSLSMVNLLLNQKRPALKHVKKPTNLLSIIQKSVVHGAQGKIDQLRAILPKINSSSPMFTDKIIAMLYSKYLAANDENYSESDIHNEQIRNFLIAA